MSDLELGVPDPDRIQTLQDLAREFSKLRRRVARKGQRQRSIRDIAACAGRAPSTLDPYLRGQRLCPVDVYEDILRALGVPNHQLRPWLQAWERIADTLEVRSLSGGRDHSGPGHTPMRDSRLVAHSQQMLYSFVRCKGSTVRLGIVTGDLRRVQCADIWVNSENTDMRMARFEEFSVSAIIRFDGASKDVTGRVVGDQIAEQLAAKVADRTPVPPGTVITTGAGELGRTNRVRYIIHVAAVHGEPGKGYRQVLDVGRCVTNTLMEAQRLAVEDSRVRAILFPLLGTGVGGGQLAATVTAMVGATIDYFVAQPTTLIQTVYLLAYTETEFETCRTILDAQPKLFEATTSPDAHNSEDAL